LSERYEIEVQSDEETTKLMKFDTNLELGAKTKSSLFYVIGSMCHYVRSRRKRKNVVILEHLESQIERKIVFLNSSEEWRKEV